MYLLENFMPRDFVPLIYEMTYLAARICTAEGHVMCWLRMEVIVVRLGCVIPESQRSDPTNVSICD